MLEIPLTLLIIDVISPSLYHVTTFFEILYERHFAFMLYCGDVTV